MGFSFGVAVRRIGARRAALTGLVIISIASFAGLLADSTGFLIFTRLFEAVGFALCTAALPSIVQAASAPEQKSLTMGVWAVWLPVGVAVAMVISYFAIDPFGWQGVYISCGVLPLLAAGFVLYYCRPGLVDRSALKGVVIKSVLTKTNILTTACFIMFSSGNLIYLGFLPTILTDELQLTPSDAVLMSFIAVLVFLPPNVLTGRWIDRGVSPEILMGCAFAGMAIAPFFLMLDVFSLPVRLGSVICFTIAGGIPPAVVWAAIPRLTSSPTEAPILTGLVYQGAGVGQLLGPIVAGSLVAYSNSWIAAGWCIFILSAMGCIFSLWLYLLRKHESQAILKT